MTCTVYFITQVVKIIAHVFTLKCIMHRQATLITLHKSLIFKQSLWKAVTKPQHRATNVETPHKPTLLLKRLEQTTFQKRQHNQDSYPSSKTRVAFCDMTTS